MNKFYVILLIQKSGQRGYVIDASGGIQIAVGGLSPYITQFDTPHAARQFIKANKLERKGCSAHVRSNEDLIKQEHAGLSPIKGEQCCIENNAGQKLFYDTKQDSYYFDSKNIGYCMWDNAWQAQQFINTIAFTESAIIKPIADC